MDKHDSLARASKELMLKEPFYGLFLIGLNKAWEKRVPTAGVSKNNINYQLSINEKFWDSLSNNHHVGVLKHELLHIAFFHLTMHDGFADKKLANVAMDMEINQYIDDINMPGAEFSREEFDALTKVVKAELEAARDKGASKEMLEAIANKLPPRGVLIKDYADMKLDLKAGCRYYYDKLKEAQEKKEKNGTCGNEPMDKLLDSIEQGDGPDHSTWEDFADLPEAERKLIEKQLEHTLKEVAEQVKSRGTVPGEMQGLLDKINSNEPPKFDWKGYLRRFTGGSQKVYTKKLRRKFNRRFEDMAGLKIKPRRHVLVAIDTSGSVCDEELREFFHEIDHMYRTGTDITVLQCDTRINSIRSYKPGDTVEVFGRAGTEFDPVIEYYNEHIRHYSCMIYLTDGECYCNVKPRGKMLWVVSSKSQMNDQLPGPQIKLN